ncbi:MAG: acetylglutamate kinase [Phycisphaerae bacterium]|nr:acetylglutamate kinase [Phycisphaerae bacterium]
MRPIVIKLGGLAVESPERATPLLSAIAAAHRERGGVVVVHGGGKAVDDHLSALGIVSVRREGLRVTGEREIGEIVAVLAGKVNKSIVGAMISIGAPAVGLCLGDGGFARATRITPGGMDIGFVGEVTGGDPRLARVLLDEGFMPVFSPIGFDESGRALNINGDDAAAGVASIIGARLLVLLTDVAGVLDGDGRLVESLDAAGAESLIESGVVTGGMIPKVRAALGAAARAGVSAVIASWNQPDVLVALARGEVRGTRFKPGEIRKGGSVG